jgi:hypothetical protein
MSGLSPRAARRVRAVVYFTVPLLVGAACMAATQHISRLNLGDKGEKLLEAQKQWEEGQVPKPHVFRKAPPAAPPQPPQPTRGL